MKTFVTKDNLEAAADFIKRGGLVAVPTETVYGLACNGLDEEAVGRIYEVKGRPPIKPLSLMVRGAGDIELYCRDVPKAAYTLAKKYWPGPLTIVLKARDIVPDIVRAGGSTVGLRCPDHELTQRMLEQSTLPFAAPSANPSGEESPKSAAKVLEYFDGLIDAVIDGGNCGIGRESTLIDMSAVPYRVLRESAVSKEELADCLCDAMCIFGITGGSGSGKTTALSELSKLGALIIDCDALYHGMLSEDAELKRELFERFPAAEKEGSVDRKALGAIVFTDAHALTDLNRITHRHIGRAVHELLREHAMNGGSIAAIDAVELISSGISDKCTAVIGISAEREIRLQRIMRRDSISREAAQMRIDAQRSDEYYSEKCDYMLMNNGDIAEFTDKFNQIIQEVLKNG